jgi:hypothetical protein
MSLVGTDRTVVEPRYAHLTKRRLFAVATLLEKLLVFVRETLQPKHRSQFHKDYNSTGSTATEIGGHTRTAAELVT